MLLFHIPELVMEEVDIIEEPQVGHVENNQPVQAGEVLVVEGGDVVEVVTVFRVSLPSQSVEEDKPNITQPVIVL